LMAWQGLGVWSLVGALFGQQVLLLIVGWVLAKPPLRPSLRGDGRSLMAYGLRHTAISFLEFLSANVDTTVVGRALGDAALGLYNRAFMLTNQPVERVAGVLSRVLFPLFATIQADRSQVGSVYLLGVAVIGVVGGAVSLALSAAAEPAVAVLLGPAWADAVPAVRVLALAIPVIFMSQVAGVMCDALAWLRFKLGVQAAGLGMVVLCMLVLYPYGLIGVALALLLAEVLRFGLYFLLLTRRLHCDRAQAWRTLAAVLVSGAMSYGLVLLAVQVAHGAGAGHFFTLLAAMTAGGLAVALACAVMVVLLAPTGAGRMAAQHLALWRRVQSLLRPSAMAGGA
jgi:lipopolysaccharide exporter